ncbi:outer membrane beta-barrel protein [Winogradskyella forsetii]|uniref:outer membrane beta-barrel protein n=1 Tax=Winogradskyella forsetii TaxID=2686077 RepID=UPI0015B9FABB|nr:outer membrane beta-barrel protein [Winogradskyella forsetii]
MKYLLSLLFVPFLLLSHAQVNFQKGYLIDNSNNKIECFIKNLDWKKNPEFITYRLTDDSSEETLTSSQLKEFRIYDTDNFYRRHTVNKKLIGPLYEDLQLRTNIFLLKVLVDSQSDLYELYTNGKYYFFYEKSNDLVFLDYKKTVDENNIIKENAKFKKQLYDNFKCDDFSLDDYSNLRYNSTNLSEFFSEVNQCYGIEYLNFHIQRTRPKISFRLSGGLNLNSSLNNENASSYVLSYSIPPFSGNPQGEDVVRNYEGIDNYKTNNNFSLGVEAEVRLPFDQNNWSGFIALNYQNVSQIEGDKNFSEPSVANFDVSSYILYSFIQIPLGVRRYFDINDKIEIYAHLAYTQNVILSTDYSTQVSEVPTSSRDYDFRSRANREKTSNSGGYFGIGLNFLGRYALDINYYALNLSIDDDYQVRMKGIGINALYTIF